jgi:hypothetical protein
MDFLAATGLAPEERTSYGPTPPPAKTNLSLPGRLVHFTLGIRNEMHFRAALFDMDGTLVDSERGILNAWMV